MFWDKLFKKNSNKNAEAELMAADGAERQDKSSRSNPKDIYSAVDQHTIHEVYEKPSLDFVDEKDSMEDMLQDLDLDVSSYSRMFDGKDADEMIKDLLYDAKDILVNDQDLSSFVDNKEIDDMELEALKASLSPKDKQRGKSAESKPVEKKPAESKPLEKKPVEIRPVENKPIESKLVDDKPIKRMLAEDKPVESKPVESKPVESKPVENKPVENKPVEFKPDENIPVEGQPVEIMPVEGDNDIFSTASDQLSTIFENDDIDMMIASALEKDKMSELTSIDDFDREFVNETIVFHDPVNINDNVAYQKPSNKLVAFFAGLSMKTMYIAAGAIALLIVVIIASTIYIGMNNSMYKLIQNLPGGMLISQPNSPVNNANYIHVGKGLAFNDDVLTLDKILLDSLGTMFYFDRPIDIKKYDITLTDDMDKLYTPDLYYWMSTLNGSGQTNVLRFSPLDENVRYFSLKISDPETGSEIEFYMAISGKIVLPVERYINKSMNLIPGDPTYGLFIEGVTLSSGGTRVNYSLHWKDDSQTIQMGVKDSEKLISLSENGRSIMSVDEFHKQYLFADEKMLLGHMDFLPLRNLNSTIRMTFSNLYKKFELDLDVNAEKLFNYKEGNNEVEIVLNEYKLVLERAGWQKTKLVLVAHTETMNLYAVSGRSREDDNRAETILDIKVRIEKSPGDEIVLDGVIRSGTIGLDIIFDASDYLNEISGIGFDKYTFEIANAYVKCDDLEFSYDLDSSRGVPEMPYANAVKAVTEAFEKRLAFKSGSGDLDSVKGFSEELSDSNYLLSNYSPIINSSAVYSAQLISSIYEGDTLYAIVLEHWKGMDGGQMKTEYSTHQIEARNSGSGWIIITDEVID